MKLARVWLCTQCWGLFNGGHDVVALCRQADRPSIGGPALLALDYMARHLLWALGVSRPTGEAASPVFLSMESSDSKPWPRPERELYPGTVLGALANESHGRAVQRGGSPAR